MVKAKLYILYNGLSVFQIDKPAREILDILCIACVICNKMKKSTFKMKMSTFMPPLCILFRLNWA